MIRVKYTPHSTMALTGVSPFISFSGGNEHNGKMQGISNLGPGASPTRHFSCLNNCAMVSAVHFEYNK